MKRGTSFSYKDLTLTGPIPVFVFGSRQIRFYGTVSVSCSVLWEL